MCEFHMLYTYKRHQLESTNTQTLQHLPLLLYFSFIYGYKYNTPLVLVVLTKLHATGKNSRPQKAAEPQRPALLV